MKQTDLANRGRVRLTVFRAVEKKKKKQETGRGRRGKSRCSRSVVLTMAGVGKAM